HLPASPSTQCHPLSLHDALPIYRCRAVVTGERGLRVEARDAGRLADQLGRRERTAAGQRQQIRTEALDQAGDLALEGVDRHGQLDRKSTRLNSSHVSISYAVFCL